MVGARTIRYSEFAIRVMPRETEAKLRVKSHDPVRERLRALGATFAGRVLETNWIFDRSDGPLRGLGCGLRVRSTVDEDTGRRRATLTFKGPVIAGPFKSRQELETQIDSAETAADILQAVGFVVILTYQKRRESWELGTCRVELDEPPHVGLFVEIEGPDEEAIRSAQAELGLVGTAHVKASYVRMLLAYRDKHGVLERVLDLPDVSASGS